MKYKSTNKKPKYRNQMLPWTELYRPQSLDRFVGSHILDLLIEIQSIGTENLHFVFIGPGGIGKTSAVHALVKTWLPHAEDRNNMVLEINASDDCGVDKIRKDVIPFMHRQSRACHSSFQKKILILDEADCITPAAQACLRVELEKCIDDCLVFLLCNFVKKIIPPILSRTIPIAFPRLSWEQIRSCLENILIDRKMEMPTEEFWIQFRQECQNGDLRQSIEKLQFVSPFLKHWEKNVSVWTTVPNTRKILMSIHKTSDVMAFAQKLDR